MRRLLHDPAVQSSESTEARVHAIEEPIDHLASEEEHLQQLEESLEHRTNEDEEHLHQLEVGLEAFQLDVGYRVSGFLLSGIFLLAVAYWYQRSVGRCGACCSA